MLKDKIKIKKSIEKRQQKKKTNSSQPDFTHQTRDSIYEIEIISFKVNQNKLQNLILNQFHYH